MKNNNQKNILLLVIVLLLVVVYVLYRKVENSDRRVVRDYSEEQDNEQKEETKEKNQDPISLKTKSLTPEPKQKYYSEELVQKHPQLQAWRAECEGKGGDFVVNYVFGISAQQVILCGFDRAPDADFYCKTKEQCAQCTYESFCQPGAADMPGNCSCPAYDYHETITYNTGGAEFK